jgi:hypothetical protein
MSLLISSIWPFDIKSAPNLMLLGLPVKVEKILQNRSTAVHNPRDFYSVSSMAARCLGLRAVLLGKSLSEERRDEPYFCVRCDSIASG